MLSGNLVKNVFSPGCQSIIGDNMDGNFFGPSCANGLIGSGFANNNVISASTLRMGNNAKFNFFATGNAIFGSNCTYNKMFAAYGSLALGDNCKEIMLLKADGQTIIGDNCSNIVMKKTNGTSGAILTIGHNCADIDIDHMENGSIADNAINLKVSGKHIGLVLSNVATPQVYTFSHKEIKADTNQVPRIMFFDAGGALVWGPISMP